MSRPNYEQLFHGACRFGEATADRAVHYANRVRVLENERINLSYIIKAAIRDLESGRPERALNRLKNTQRK
jgi:hypothetical protein